MLNWLLRYQPIIHLANELSPSTVLDVGSGWHGLSWYWPGRVVQTDLLFVGDRPMGHAGEAVYVASSAERLPFVDAAFDLVVSSDMVEHLPSAIRSESLHELARVARRAVIVGFPVGRTARLADRLLARVLRGLFGFTPEWLAEHLKQEEWPTRQLLESSLPAGWSIERDLPHGNVAVVLALYVAEVSGRLRRWTDEIEKRHLTRRFPRFFHLPPVYRRIFVVRGPGYTPRDAGERSHSK